MSEPEGDVGYAEAISELDRILEEIEADDVDVDVLTARVTRAAELIRMCRSRIATARVEVERVVAELESDAASPSVGDDVEEAGPVE